MGIDLDGDGSTDDAFAIVLVDVAIPGAYYSGLFVDDGDGDLRNEVALSPVKAGGVWTAFKRAVFLPVWVLSWRSLTASAAMWFSDSMPTATAPMSLALRLGHDPSGQLIVAGIAAPGARLMVVKALSANGSGTWTIRRGRRVRRRKRSRRASQCWPSSGQRYGDEQGVPQTIAATAAEYAALSQAATRDRASLPRPLRPTTKR